MTTTFIVLWEPNTTVLPRAESFTTIEEARRFARSRPRSRIVERERWTPATGDLAWANVRQPKGQFRGHWGSLSTGKSGESKPLNEDELAGVQASIRWDRRTGGVRKPAGNMVKRSCRFSPPANDWLAVASARRVKNFDGTARRARPGRIVTATVLEQDDRWRHFGERLLGKCFSVYPDWHYRASEAYARACRAVAEEDRQQLQRKPQFLSTLEVA
jgi:hypothetical protein